MKKTTMLLIMDGFGMGKKSRGNAIESAKKPVLDNLMKECPMTLLKASGRAVGLPEGQMGNSEVGHMNMGAGRVVWQDLSRISNAVSDGSFFENPALKKAMEHAKKGGDLHIFGLYSDGGVHSHTEHIKALCRMAKKAGIENLFLHCFTDGRDTPPTSAEGYIKDLESYLKDLGVGSVGSVIGRYYAMDRDKRWERLEAAYDALTGKAPKGKIFSSGGEAVQDAYLAGETDEFIKPRLCAPFKGILEGDTVIFANFRPDRAREMTRALTDPDFDGFERKFFPKNLFFVCMAQYDATLKNVETAYPPEKLTNTLGEYVSSLGLSQLRIAETEKYAHVTFFFNGGREEPFKGEERILAPSPKVATYDLKPEMSAYEITEKVIPCIRSGMFDMIILNFANCDMVGHTGVFAATVKAVETVDFCVGKIVNEIKKAGGVLLVTADHGNADEMLDSKGEVVTAHSVNPVPLILVNGKENESLENGGALSDIAPTMLSLMGLSIPKEMTGKSLLKR